MTLAFCILKFRFFARTGGKPANRRKRSKNVDRVSTSLPITAKFRACVDQHFLAVLSKVRDLFGDAHAEDSRIVRDSQLVDTKFDYLAAST